MSICIDVFASNTHLLPADFCRDSKILQEMTNGIFIIMVILKDEELVLVYDDSPGKGTVIGSFICAYSLVYVISIINIYAARKIIGIVKSLLS